MSIIVFLVLRDYFVFDSWQPILNNILSILFLLIIVGFPVFCGYWLIKNIYRVENQDFRERYSTLYENIKTYKPRIHFYILTFLLKRLVFAVTMVCTGYEIQLAFQIIFSMFVLGHLLKY